MSKLRKAVEEISRIDYIASRDQWLNNVHPLVKLCLTLFYIVLTVSFSKYDLIGVLGMFIYPFVMFQVGEISFKDALKRLKIVLPVVCIVGLFNPFLDTELVTIFGGYQIRAGMISMITLMLKGIFTVLASYIFIASTTIEKICYAMRLLHLPKIFVTEIMLIYRYITLLLSEANTMSEAYALRAPGQKGVAYKVWGSFIGQLILRSVDRADTVYRAMNLRGYSGDYYCEKIDFKPRDIVLLIIWILLLVVFRALPVLSLVGELFI